MSEHTGHGARDLPCNELVELITEYLDDALPALERTQVDEHLEFCDGCATVLAQWREVIHLSGRLTARDVDALDPDTRQDLMATFREHRGS